MDRRRAESRCSTHARHRHLDGNVDRDKRDAKLRSKVTGA
jgi:hypothetical protein